MIRTRDLRHVKAINSPDFENEPIAGVSLPTQSEDIIHDSNVSGAMKKGTAHQPVPLNEYVKQYEQPFLSYMIEIDSPKSEGTRKDYINGLKKLKPILEPLDVGRYHTLYPGENLTSKQRNGIRKFFEFMRKRQYKIDFNGYPHELYIEQVGDTPAAESTVESSRRSNIKPEELQEAYQRLDVIARPFFTFLIYSGVRSEQAYHIFSTFDISKVNVFKPEGTKRKVATYDMRDITHDKKQAIFAFFPPEFLPQMEQYSGSKAELVTHDNLKKKIIESAKGKGKEAINAASLRKFNFSLMTLKPEPTIDILRASRIQSRSERVSKTEESAISQQTSWKHYTDRDLAAAQAYATIIPKLLTAFPIPKLIPSKELVKQKKK